MRCRRPAAAWRPPPAGAAFAAPFPPALPRLSRAQPRSRRPRLERGRRPWGERRRARAKQEEGRLSASPRRGSPVPSPGRGGVAWSEGAGRGVSEGEPRQAKSKEPSLLARPRRALPPARRGVPLSAEETHRDAVRRAQLSRGLLFVSPYHPRTLFHPASKEPSLLAVFSILVAFLSHLFPNRRERAQPFPNYLPFDRMHLFHGVAKFGVPPGSAPFSIFLEEDPRRGGTLHHVRKK